MSRLQKGLFGQVKCRKVEKWKMRGRRWMRKRRKVRGGISMLTCETEEYSCRPTWVLKELELGDYGESIQVRKRKGENLDDEE